MLFRSSLSSFTMIVGCFPPWTLRATWQQKLRTMSNSIVLERLGAPFCESRSSFPHSPIRLIPDQSLTLILKNQYHGGVRWHAQVTRLGCAPLIYSIFTTDMLLHVTDLSSSLLLTVWLLFLWVLAWPRCRGAFWRDFYFDSKASGWSKKVIFIKVNSRAGHFLNEMAISLPKISHLSGADKLNVQWWGSQ